MNIGYIDQTKFRETEFTSLVPFATKSEPKNFETFQGKYIRFKYYLYNFTSTKDVKNVDIYFLPYGVDISSKTDISFKLLYDNFFSYYKRPTVMISFVGIKLLKESERNVFSILAEDVINFVKKTNLNVNDVLGASMGARAAVSLSVQLKKLGKLPRKVNLYELPGLNPSSVFVDFYKTLFFDKHYNLNIKDGGVSSRQNLNKLANYTRITKRFFQNIKFESKTLSSISKKNFYTELEDLDRAKIKTQIILGEDSHLSNKSAITLKRLRHLDHLQVYIVSSLGHYVGKNVSEVNRLTEEICLHDITKHKAYSSLEI